MGQSLGQPVVIENVTGAGGTIAAGRVARAAPDGYTLDLATWSTHVVTPGALSSAIRCLPRFRSGGVADADAIAAGVQERYSGERFEGAGRLAEGQIRPSAARQRRRHRSGGGFFAPATNRCENPGRALSRRRRRRCRT